MQRHHRNSFTYMALATAQNIKIIVQIDDKQITYSRPPKIVLCNKIETLMEDDRYTSPTVTETASKILSNYYKKLQKSLNTKNILA